MKNLNPSFQEISHHLFTPLNHILGMAQVLKLSTDLDSEQRQYVETIIHASVELNQQLEEQLSQHEWSFSREEGQKDRSEI